jgi:hypothetical protein
MRFLSFFLVGGFSSSLVWDGSFFVRWVGVISLLRCWVVLAHVRAGMLLSRINRGLE